MAVKYAFLVSMSISSFKIIILYNLYFFDEILNRILDVLIRHKSVDRKAINKQLEIKINILFWSNFGNFDLDDFKIYLSFFVTHNQQLWVFVASGGWIEAGVSIYQCVKIDRAFLYVFFTTISSVWLNRSSFFCTIQWSPWIKCWYSQQCDIISWSFYWVGFLIMMFTLQKHFCGFHDVNFLSF